MDRDPDTRPDEFAETIETPPVPAPGDSHLKEFRLVNRAFSGDGLPSQLYVTFREKKLKRSDRIIPEATYVYETTDHRHLATVFARMSVMASPGELIAPELEGRGIRGHQIG